MQPVQKNWDEDGRAKRRATLRATHLQCLGGNWTADTDSGRDYGRVREQGQGRKRDAWALRTIIASWRTPTTKIIKASKTCSWTTLLAERDLFGGKNMWLMGNSRGALAWRTNLAGQGWRSLAGEPWGAGRSCGRVSGCLGALTGSS